jgi:hypothetical protein
MNILRQFNLAQKIGLKYDGHDKHGHWFCYKDNEWNFPNTTYDIAKDKAAARALALFEKEQR